MITNRIAKRTQLTLARPKIPVNKISNNTTLTMFPIMIQGLNFPHRVLVLSTMFPRSGSMTNSRIRTATISPVIRPISLSATDVFKPLNMPPVTKIMK